MNGVIKFTLRELNALLDALSRAEAGEPETEDEDVLMYPRLADKIRKELGSLQDAPAKRKQNA